MTAPGHADSAMMHLHGELLRQSEGYTTEDAVSALLLAAVELADDGQMTHNEVRELLWAIQGTDAPN